MGKVLVLELDNEYGMLRNADNIDYYNYFKYSNKNIIQKIIKKLELNISSIFFNEWKNKKVSVIMGVYNPKDKEKLCESINSILNQTYKNIEFIICDDCSNDDTKKYLRDFSKKDKRIKLIENKSNLGLAASLNNCLKIADGFYIARQDDDDISKLNRIEKEVLFLEENNMYDFIGCNLELFDKNGILEYRKHKEKPVKEDFLYGNQFPHPAMLLTKRCLDEVCGYRVKKTTRRTEDYDLFMRLYAKGYTGYNLQEYLYQYNEDMYGYSKRKFRYRIDEF